MLVVYTCHIYEVINRHHTIIVLAILFLLKYCVLCNVFSFVILEQDQLLKAAYETEPVISEDIELDLWTYRQRVSLEHLRFTIQEKTLKKKYSILYHFLQLVR